MGLLDVVFERRYGVKTRWIDRPVTNTCANAITLLLRSNKDRLEVGFVNHGDNNLYLYPGPAVSATNGWFLPSNGGTLVMLAEEEGELVTRQWYGITAAGNSAMFIWELVAIGG